MPKHCLPRLFAALSAACLLPACAAVNGVAPAAESIRPLTEAEARFARDFGAFLDHAMARLEAVPALSVAVARSDRPIFVRAFGHADIQRNLPATADTRFYIASSTKSFVGLAFALLDARGDIDLDWTLAELAPDIAFAPGVRAGEVTLRHLLSHSHGLEGAAIEFRLAFSGEHDPETLWRLLGSLSPNDDAPLGTFNYGNVGYNVAALLVERRLGRRWQEIVETEILEPAGMLQTLTRGLDSARSHAVFAAPYDSGAPGGPVRLYLVKQDDTMQSAGGMFSSANDLAQWVRIQLAAAKGLTVTPLPAATVATTHQPVASLDQRFEMFRRTGYGLGWYSGDYEGETLYHSFGSFAGARAHVSFRPAQDLGVAALANDEATGFILPDVAAAYAYAWFADGPEAAERQGRDLVERIAREAGERLERAAAERAERAGRPWRLTQPPQAYVGRYCNADFGSITMRHEGGKLEMRMGRLQSDAEPFDRDDAIRVEPIPGRGLVLQFRSDGRPVAVQAFGRTFERCN